MVQEAITNYIKLAKLQKIPKKQIIASLLKVGWEEEEIKKGFTDEVQPAIPVPPNSNNNITINLHNSMWDWDTFEHILMFISLYVLATSLGLMLHAFIDKWVLAVPPNSVKDYFSLFLQTLIRAYLAALIVSYLLFAFFFLRITRKTIENPILRTLMPRKMLIYFTLVVTFLIFIYKIISTVYTILNGNITSNFILHLLVTLAISSIIFSYYIYQIKDDRNANA
ncbi:hypothetical protein HY029_06070 [Candidatus Gottesmanbacteria bacterium]|nr:hypothetical protein [Candidatus Gottesmanbacteria bacterium]